jgi:hypothetical protein
VDHEVCMTYEWRFSIGIAGASAFGRQRDSAVSIFHVFKCYYSIEEESQKAYFARVSRIICAGNTYSVT